MNKPNQPDQITLPNEWTPRPYQVAPWQYFMNGGKKAALLWHRRAGKDSFAINMLATIAIQGKAKVFWYMAPNAAQVRKIVWQGIDGEGRRVLDQSIPKQLRLKTNDAEMRVELLNGSIIQFVGSDNYDSLVGANPSGVIFSEFALADPQGYDFIRPILAENNGFALFISTARGKNHFHKIFQAFEKDPNAFTDTQTVETTKRPDGTPVITPEAIEEEREMGMPEDLIQQEFYSSWEGGMQGAYYTDEINDIRKHRMIEAPTPTHELTVTFWDIGISDATAIGFFQRLQHNDCPIMVHYHEERNKSLEDYIRQLKNLPYTLELHYGPHDLNVREFSTGKTRYEAAQDMGFNFNIIGKFSLDEGINQARRFLRSLYVLNTPATQMFLDAVAQYTRQYNAKTKVYTDKPLHNFASHPADMLRYAALGWNADDLRTRPSTIKYTSSLGGTKMVNTRHKRGY